MNYYYYSYFHAYLFNVQAYCRGYTLQLSVSSLLEEDVVATHLPTEPSKISVWVGAGTELWTQYLPAL